MGVDRDYLNACKTLKSRRWRIKAPSGSSTELRYACIRSGGTTKDVEGVDCLLGEQAVIDFVAGVARATPVEPAAAAGRTTRSERTTRLGKSNKSVTAPAALAAANEIPSVSDRVVAEFDHVAASTCADSAAEPYHAVPDRSNDEPVANVPDNESGVGDDGIHRVSTTQTRRSKSTARTRALASTTRVHYQLVNNVLVDGAKPPPLDEPTSLSVIVEFDEYVNGELVRTEEGYEGDVDYSADDEVLGDDEWCDTRDESVEGTECDEYEEKRAQPEPREHEDVGRDILSDFGDDLNEFKSGEDRNDFTALDSGDDPEKDDLNETRDIASDPFQFAQDVSYVPDFIHADLRMQVIEQTLRKFAVSGWKDVEEPDVDAHLQELYVSQPSADGYPNRKKGYSGPAADALRCGDSPTRLVLLFLPVLLRRHIAACSHEYNRDQVINRVNERFKKRQTKRPATHNLRPNRSARFAKK